MAKRSRRFWLGMAAGALLWGLAPQGAAAGVNPADPGLPRALTPWGASLDGRNFSSLCVGCHTENPSARTSAPAAMAVGDTEVMYRGSHFMRNRLDGVDRFTDPARAAPVASGGWEKVTAWATAGLSKYGVVATGQSVTGSAGELICESCHNLRMNGGRRLLLDVWSITSGEATLCSGCHAEISGATHHPLGAVNNADRAGVRNPPTDAAGGYLKTDGVRYYPPPHTVSCVSCHKPHDAWTATGARVLRRGASRVATLVGLLERPLNVVYYDNIPIAGGLRGQVITRKPAAVGAATGVHRNADMDDGKRLVINADPLCDACHKYND
ncbi:MAG: hypothetical protein ACYDA8_12445 [Deferrisomatales bacterium]